MAVKTVVSGKHPVIVRIGVEDYKVLAVEAAKIGRSVNEMIAQWCVDYVREIKKEEP